MLEQKTSDFINQNIMFNTKDNILVGVSGGIDSVVLIHILTSLNYNCSIAHCNFQLRGLESDEDENFVIELAKKLKIPIFSKKFKTKEFAKENSISTQMAARNLRIDWMMEIFNEYGFKKICLAHHLNDNIETFFLNTFRGTGINGLKAILPNSETFCRPILFALRSEIEDYASKNKIYFREDSSNKTDDYSRNKIRHNIIPTINKQFPDFISQMNENLNRIKNDVSLFHELIENQLNPFLKNQNDIIELDLSFLGKIKNSETLLFHFLNKFNFNIQTVNNIYKNIDLKETRSFFSNTHIASRKNLSLLIKPISENTENLIFTINSIDDLEKLEFPLTFETKILDITEVKSFKISKIEAYFDLDKIAFPLIIRKHQNGDYFTPFGMKMKQKLSDFFINNKLNQFEKDNIWLLISNENIIWIIGQRASNKTKIDKNTKNILNIKVLS